MKNILYTLITLMIFSSCEKDNFENTFDKSPEERIAEANKKYKDLLISSKYGWETNYFVEGSKSMQGSTMIMMFKPDGRVSILGDHTATRETSEYIIHQEASTQLKFSTYNKNLTWLATPGGRNPEGMGGELEFIFISSTEDEIILEGKVNKGKLILKKTTKTELPFWRFKAIKDQLVSLNTNGYMAFRIKGNTKNKYSFDFNKYKNTVTISHNEGGKLFKEERAMIFTADGFIFNEALILNGKVVNSLHYSGEIEKVEGGKGYSIKKSGDFTFKSDNFELQLVNVSIPVFYIPGMIKTLKKGSRFTLVYGGTLGTTLRDAAIVSQMELLNNYQGRIGSVLNITMYSGNQVIVDCELIEIGLGLIQFKFGEIHVIINSDFIDDPDTEINEIEVERKAVLVSLKNNVGFQNYLKEMSKESGYFGVYKGDVFGGKILRFISSDDPLSAVMMVY